VPSGEKSTLHGVLDISLQEGSFSVFRSAPVAASYSLMVPSMEADANRLPIGEKAMLTT
jgi:hypothetical protein